ncbi:SDR family NAD(P)-dependent oxidoreductase [Salinicoccus albus]|uniref:SDR family NAD(P)-dependent oxidoreductase n=1 Tax=Salinicoccus albus TaxID=418756 RepID=UPI0003648CDE|nr:SDR family NAD(P)-dependent oxidoreductase [Salinicoccus albus]
MRKVIWITGASSGFGLAAALKLLRETDHIICVSARRESLLDTLVKKGAYAYPLDITDYEEIFRTKEKIENEAGEVDALMVNAGYGMYGTFEEVPNEAMIRQFEVNVFGAVETIRSVLPSMRKRSSGRIVITSSSAAHVSSAGMGYYAASKHSIKALGTALRQEIGPHGIEVVMIEPGIVRTPFGETALKNNYIDTEKGPYASLMKTFKSFMLKSFDRAPSVSHTRDIMVKALTDDRVKSVYRTTSSSLGLSLLSKLLPASIYDFVIREGVKKLR